MIVIVDIAAMAAHHQLCRFWACRRFSRFVFLRVSIDQSLLLRCGGTSRQRTGKHQRTRGTRWGFLLRLFRLLGQYLFECAGRCLFHGCFVLKVRGPGMVARIYPRDITSLFCVVRRVGFAPTRSSPAGSGLVCMPTFQRPRPYHFAHLRYQSVKELFW